MQQQAAALHMAQEVVAQTNALTGTLDQAGDIGADKARALTHRHDTQGGHQRGEVIVRDLGLGRADGGDEGGLTHIGEADQPTSAISFSSSVTWMSSPGIPGLANLGIWRVGVAKCALP